MRITVAIAIAVVVTAGLAGAARADAIADADRAAQHELDEAERALRDLRYEEASARLDRAERSGQNGPRALARLYRLDGEVAATLGDAPAARAAFARWLAIEPTATLAPGTSPKITAPFTAAAAQLGGAALDVAFRVDDTAAAVALEIRSDPLAMVTGARAFYRGAADVGRAEAGIARVELALPRAGRLQVVVAALDMHGNRLAEHELTLESATAPPEPRRAAPRRAAAPRPAAGAVVAAPPPPARSRFHRGWALTGAAVGLGAVGGFYAVRATQAQNELDALNASSGEHSYVEAEAAADRLRTRAIVANTGLALAGACALAAALLWPDAPPDHPARRVSWQVGSDGARAALEWSW
jgi:hypothetical protein